MWRGAKTADLRDLSDRDIQVGDWVWFHENCRKDGRTGRSIQVEVTHIQRGYILPSPCCVRTCSEAGTKTGVAGAMLSFRVVDTVDL